MPGAGAGALNVLGAGWLADALKAKPFWGPEDPSEKVDPPPGAEKGLKPLLPPA